MYTCIIFLLLCFWYPEYHLANNRCTMLFISVGWYHGEDSESERAGHIVAREGGGVRLYGVTLGRALDLGFYSKCSRKHAIQYRMYV